MYGVSTSKRRAFESLHLREAASVDQTIRRRRSQRVDGPREEVRASNYLKSRTVFVVFYAILNRMQNWSQGTADNLKEEDHHVEKPPGGCTYSRCSEAEAQQFYENTPRETLRQTQTQHVTRRQLHLQEKLEAILRIIFDHEVKAGLELIRFTDKEITLEAG